MNQITVKGSNVNIVDFSVNNSALAKLMDPIEMEQRAELLTELLSMAASAVTKIETDVEIRVLQTAAEQVKEGLTEAGANSVKAIQEFFDLQLNEEKPGNFFNLIQSRLTSSIFNDLALSNENSPLHPLFNQLKAVLEKEAQDQGEDSLYENSREKGIDFEESVHQLIAQVAGIHGDDAEFVGNTATESGGKEGDSLVNFDPALQSGRTFRVVWESKTEKEFKNTKNMVKKDKTIKELNHAIRNRQADCAVLVIDSRGLDLKVQPEFETFDGNKCLVVINQDKPDVRLIRLAYLWSKAYAAKLAPAEGRELDIEAIDRELGNIERLSGHITNIKTQHTAIKTGLEGAGAHLGYLKIDLDKAVASLSELITPESDD
jgi:hypothetical protein